MTDDDCPGEGVALLSVGRKPRGSGAMPMVFRRSTWRGAVLASLIGGGLGTAVLAQGEEPRWVATPGLAQSNIVREVLGRFPGTDVVAFNGTFEPGARPGRHRHPGPEIVHVIEGRGLLLQDGREPIELRQGMTVISEPPPDDASFAHEIRNLSDTEPLKTYVVLLLAKGQPPALPAE